MKSAQVHQADSGKAVLPEAAVDAARKEGQDFPLVIATMPATGRQQAIAVGIIVLLTVAAAVIAPFASIQVARVDAFIPVLQTVLSVVDFITRVYGKPDVTMSDEVLEATNALRKFMFENVYLAGPAKTEDRKAQGVLWELLGYFEQHPDLLPPEHQRIGNADGNKRAVADYVAGMTDRYALDTYASIFIPSGWSHL